MVREEHSSQTTLPRPLDFAIVGAAKSGTSSLSALMDGNPEIAVLSPKDGHPLLKVTAQDRWTGPRDEVFNQKIATSDAEYTQQLTHLPDTVRVGESSVFYMTNRAVLEALRDRMTDTAPVIAVLRRPDARAYSAYMHMVREGLEEGSFSDGLAAERQRVVAGWQPIWWYQRLGYYSRQVENLFEVFGQHRVHVILYEDLTRDPQSALSALHSTLGVRWHQVDLPTANASGVPKSERLQRFLSDDSLLKQVGRHVVPRLLWLKLRGRLQHRNLKRVPMTPQDRAHLIDAYRDDIDRLEELLGRNLSAWKA